MIMKIFGGLHFVADVIERHKAEESVTEIAGMRRLSRLYITPYIYSDDRNLQKFFVCVVCTSQCTSEVGISFGFG